VFTEYSGTFFCEEVKEGDAIFTEYSARGTKKAAA